VPERILATTQVDNAIRLLGARIGTVNGVCGGLVSELALGLGLSLVAKIIIDQTQTSIFQQASDASIGKYASNLDRLERLFGYGEGQKRKDWRDGVNAIVERTRQQHAVALAGFAARSIAGFARLLPKPLSGGFD
jgi:ATP-dependent helicase/nuclease subunit A